MHSIEGHVSSHSFVYRTDETFEDIRRKKIKGKKVSSFYTTYNFAVELTATGNHYAQELHNGYFCGYQKESFHE